MSSCLFLLLVTSLIHTDRSNWLATADTCVLSLKAVVHLSELKLDLFYFFFGHLSWADVALELLSVGSTHAIKSNFTDDMAACE